jgi:hypothetical protein
VIIPGNYIRFNYREQAPNPGKSDSPKYVINEYSGYVGHVYRNGQFLLTNSQGNDPMRFERIAIVEYL